MFTGVFGKQILTGFDYNKKDQTRDPRTCCEFCCCVFIEFEGCLTNETVWRLPTGFKSDKGALSLNCRNLKKRKNANASALKIKVVREILYIHAFFMTLFSHAGTSSVLEFYIGYLRPVFLWKTTIYTYEINGKKLISRSALAPCRQPLVSHVFPFGNRFSSEI